MKAIYLKVRLLLGTISLSIGLLAANLALFGWHTPDSSLYLLGEYAHYAFAYGGFASIILGSMLINEFLVLKTSIAKKLVNRRKATAWLIRARAEWQLANKYFWKFSKESEVIQPDFLVDTEEEREVVNAR
jgi:hypothetical protein